MKKIENPFTYLKMHAQIEKQKLKFDYFIYSEDDILFSKKNFKYWLNYKNICIKNLILMVGFLRTENKNRKLFSTDLIKQIKFQMLN